MGTRPAEPSRPVTQHRYSCPLPRTCSKPSRLRVQLLADVAWRSSASSDRGRCHKANSRLLSVSRTNASDNAPARTWPCFFCFCFLSMNVVCSLVGRTGFDSARLRKLCGSCDFLLEDSPPELVGVQTRFLLETQAWPRSRKYHEHVAILPRKVLHEPLPCSSPLPLCFPLMFQIFPLWQYVISVCRPARLLRRLFTDTFASPLSGEFVSSVALVFRHRRLVRWVEGAESGHRYSFVLVRAGCSKNVQFRDQNATSTYRRLRIARFGCSSDAAACTSKGR
ncbi:hypothetical protein B0I35DRAFT_433164 [Stachybotrys elegans]|uniref:Uncharacterized protein n=1 Tax=Stachybotrys elegans TaxID=80388 RepID=A0A8K0SQF8_9HYPO|nr:hypothetical protein B0I35DRAFT_433164 [Stachybotrys elegans]